MSECPIGGGKDFARHGQTVLPAEFSSRVRVRNIADTHPAEEQSTVVGGDECLRSVEVETAVPLGIGVVVHKKVSGAVNILKAEFFVRNTLRRDTEVFIAAEREIIGTLPHIA